MRNLVLVSLMLAVVSTSLYAGVRSYGRGTGGSSNANAVLSINTLSNSFGFDNEDQRSKCEARGYDPETQADADLCKQALGKSSNTLPASSPTGTFNSPGGTPLGTDFYNAACQDYIDANSGENYFDEMASGKPCSRLTKAQFTPLKTNRDQALDHGFASYADLQEGSSLDFSNNPSSTPRADCESAKLYYEARGETASPVAARRADCAGALSPPTADQCTTYGASISPNARDDCEDMTYTEYQGLNTYLSDTTAQQSCFASVADRTAATALGYAETCADADLWAAAKGLAQNPYPSGRAEPQLINSRSQAIGTNHYEADCDHSIATDNDLTGDGCTALTKDAFVTIRTNSDNARYFGFDGLVDQSRAGTLAFTADCAASSLYNEARGRSTHNTTYSSCSDTMVPPAADDCTTYITGFNILSSGGTQLAGCNEMTKPQYIAFKGRTDETTDVYAQLNCYASAAERTAAMALGYDGDSCDDADLWAAANNRITNPYPPNRADPVLRTASSSTPLRFTNIYINPLNSNWVTDANDYAQKCISTRNWYSWDHDCNDLTKTQMQAVVTEVDARLDEGFHNFHASYLYYTTFRMDGIADAMLTSTNEFYLRQYFPDITDDDIQAIRTRLSTTPEQFNTCYLSATTDKYTKTYDSTALTWVIDMASTYRERSCEERLSNHGYNALQRMVTAHNSNTDFTARDITDYFDGLWYGMSFSGSMAYSAFSKFKHGRYCRTATCTDDGPESEWVLRDEEVWFFNHCVDQQNVDANRVQSALKQCYENVRERADAVALYKIQEAKAGRIATSLITKETIALAAGMMKVPGLTGNAQEYTSMTYSSLSDGNQADVFDGGTHCSTNTEATFTNVDDNDGSATSCYQLVIDNLADAPDRQIQSNPYHTGRVDTWRNNFKRWLMTDTDGLQIANRLRNRLKLGTTHYLVEACQEAEAALPDICGLPFVDSCNVSAVPPFNIEGTQANSTNNVQSIIGANSQGNNALKILSAANVTGRRYMGYDLEVTIGSEFRNSVGMDIGFGSATHTQPIGLSIIQNSTDSGAQATVVSGHTYKVASNRGFACNACTNTDVSARPAYCSENYGNHVAVSNTTLTPKMCSGGSQASARGGFSDPHVADYTNVFLCAGGGTACRTESVAPLEAGTCQ